MSTHLLKLNATAPDDFPALGIDETEQGPLGLPPRFELQQIAGEHRGGEARAEGNQLDPVRRFDTVAQRMSGHADHRKAVKYRSWKARLAGHGWIGMERIHVTGQPVDKRLLRRRRQRNDAVRHSIACVPWRWRRAGVMSSIDGKASVAIAMGHRR